MEHRFDYPFVTTAITKHSMIDLLCPDRYRVPQKFVSENTPPLKLKGIDRIDVVIQYTPY